MLEAGTGGILVAVTDEAFPSYILGGLGFSLIQNMYTGKREIVESFIVTRPQEKGRTVFKDLMKAFHEYGEQMGATRYLVGTLNNLVHPKTMTRFGYREIGRFYER